MANWADSPVYQVLSRNKGKCCPPILPGTKPSGTGNQD
ncbi:hypothetical protein HAP32_02457 [Serratia fonticola]|nr:hypothetical protein HAP32_02457 [Serratia fonticola]